MRTELAVASRAGWFRLGARALLDLVYPETCVLCGAERGSVPWSAGGPQVPGLGWTDGPHCCRECAGALAPDPQRRVLATGAAPVHAGRATGPELVSVLGQWKYHGVRGLAWTLAPLLGAAVAAAAAQDGAVGQLVPVALHGRRRRLRGFNQAEVLARLAAADTPGCPAVRTDLLRRTRATGQQARLEADTDRRRNVAGAFAAVRGPGPADNCRVGLVDDLVTGGATAEAAGEALQAVGWQVVWVAALGLAGGSGPAPAPVPGQVDTAPAEF